MVDTLTESGVRPGRFAPYRAVLGSRLRSQRAYPLSFALDLASAVLIGVVEFAEMWVIVHNLTSFGGLTLNAMILLFGIANVSWSIADLLVGHLDTIPVYLREGRLEAFYLRPQPILLQLLTSEISLRRLGRLSVGIACLIYGFAHSGLQLSGSNIALLALTIPSGTAIFAGLFVWAGSVQFFLINAPEFSNAFTYGGSYAAAQPLSVFSPGLRVVFGWIFPVTFVAYLPTIALLGLPGPDWFPAWLAWFAPAAALWVWAIALLLWRWGSRHYQGGGG